MFKRCFCSQMCSFRQVMLPCEWHHGSTIFIRSLKRLRLERRRHTHAFVWHPYSPIRYYWDCVQLFFTFAALLYMPIQVFKACKYIIKIISNIIPGKC